jgi:hypothetical protein
MIYLVYECLNKRLDFAVRLFESFYGIPSIAKEINRILRYFVRSNNEGVKLPSDGACPSNTSSCGIRRQVPTRLPATEGYLRHARSVFETTFSKRDVLADSL